jgi:sec-independent protein translocase protein TatB
MFDVGGAELLIIALVAVIVLGPERLPKAARFAGLWIRRARAQWYSVKAELERELAQEDLKRQFGEPLAQMRPMVENLQREMKQEFDSLDPGLPARVDLRLQLEESATAPADAPPDVATEAPPAAEPTMWATELPAAPTSDRPAPDEPTTGDLFGGPPGRG